MLSSWARPLRGQGRGGGQGCAEPDLEAEASQEVLAWAGRRNGKRRLVRRIRERLCHRGSTQHSTETVIYYICIIKQSNIRHTLLEVILNRIQK